MYILLGQIIIITLNCDCFHFCITFVWILVFLLTAYVKFILVSSEIFLNERTEEIRISKTTLGDAEQNVFAARVEGAVYNTLWIKCK